MLEPKQEFWPLTFWILHQTLFTHIGVIKVKEENLTLYDIERASSNYLRSVLKNGFADVEVEDMIEKELYIREQRRPIGSP